MTDSEWFLLEEITLGTPRALKRLEAICIDQRTEDLKYLEEWRTEGKMKEFWGIVLPLFGTRRATEELVKETRQALTSLVSEVVSRERHREVVNSLVGADYVLRDLARTAFAAQFEKYADEISTHLSADSSGEADGGYIG
jgi:hypothetical protein